MNSLNQKQEMNKKLFYIGFLLFFVSLGLLFALMTQLNLYCDDYRYATFFKDGLSGFWENTKQHYLITNGRVFVHLLLPVVLLFKTNLYMFLFPLFLLGIFYYGTKVQSDSFDFRQIVFAMTIAILLFLGMSLAHYRAAVFWVSGDFNYVFPVFFVLVTLFLLKRNLEKNKISPLTLIFCFLSGATTEQCGAMAMMGMFLLGITFFLRKKAKLSVCFIPLLLALFGYFTILMAPGTDARIDADGGGALGSVFQFEVFHQRYSNVFSYFTGENGYNLLGVLLFAGVGLLPKVDKTVSKILYVGILLAALSLLFDCLKWYGIATLIFIIFTFLFACYFLKKESFLGLSITLFLVLVSQGIMLFTTISSYRVAVPGILMLILGVSFLWCQILQRCNLVLGISFLAALFFVGLLSFLPMLYGCIQTNKVYDENIANLEEGERTGSADITVDFEDPCGYALLVGDTYFHYDFRTAYDVSPQTKIYLKCPTLPMVYANGQKSTAPALVWNSELYFPLNSVLGEYDIGTKWHSDGRVTILYGDNSIELFENKCTIKNSDGNVISKFDAYTYNDFVMATLFLDAKSFEKIFGLIYTYNAETNSYWIEKK